ncbi:MAG TPA: flagellar export chaperone FliS [Bdellovibrionota bacterium]|jgi:flagellar secretion chaperone FliS|nr:flagellar export chaperone FliS [Bdellovibrionota bacterium]
MSNGYGANQYKQTAVKTANRGTLLLMLYEAAIKNVKMATVAIDDKDLSAKGKAIGKAHDIVNELMNTLDFNVGGDIARDLERLYHFMTEQLVKANLDSSKNPAAAKEALNTVRKLLETLLEGWRGAVEQVNKGTAK